MIDANTQASDNRAALIAYRQDIERTEIQNRTRLEAVFLWVSLCNAIKRHGTMIGFKHAALLAVGIGFTGASQATLIDRGGGMIYDADQNITWTANANINGLMDWATAAAWAGNLTFGGYSDWRLPKTPDNDLSVGYNKTDSEIGHLFYTEMGITAGNGFTNTFSNNTALFSNFQDVYWSGSEYGIPYVNAAWIFTADVGYQTISFKGYQHYAWAVRTGDVATISTVPEPSVIWLFGVGLGLLVFTIRRKSKDSPL